MVQNILKGSHFFEKGYGAGSKACMLKGTIQHEMLHALGFLHEHVRPDRDQFVTVNDKNIRSGKVLVKKLTRQALLYHKLIRRFQGGGVEFFKPNLTDPPRQIFDA